MIVHGDLSFFARPILTRGSETKLLRGAGARVNPELLQSIEIGCQQFEFLAAYSKAVIEVFTKKDEP